MGTGPVWVGESQTPLPAPLGACVPALLRAAPHHEIANTAEPQNPAVWHLPGGTSCRDVGALSEPQFS